MTDIIDLTYGAPIETVCIDCGEPVTVNRLTDDPATARCHECALEAVPADVRRMAANQFGHGLIAVMRQKAAALDAAHHAA